MEGENLTNEIVESGEVNSETSTCVEAPIEEPPREEESKDNAAVSEEEKREKWFEEDREKFYKDYPENTIDELLKDKRFVKYAEKRIGVDAMSDIYADYLSLVEEIRGTAKKEAEDEMNKILAKQKATPGSLTEVSSTPQNEFYTIEEIKKMSADYIDEHWEKVQRSIQRARKQ